LPRNLEAELQGNKTSHEPQAKGRLLTKSFDSHCKEHLKTPTMRNSCIAIGIPEQLVKHSQQAVNTSILVYIFASASQA